MLLFFLLYSANVAIFFHSDGFSFIFVSFFFFFNIKMEIMTENYKETHAHVIIYVMNVCK